MTAVACPDRSLEQRRAALAAANEIRSSRSRLKRDLRTGRENACRIVANPPAFTETMAVQDVLLATRRVGTVKAWKVLRSANLSPAKPLGSLTARQRDVLLDAMRAAGGFDGTAEAPDREAVAA